MPPSKKLINLYPIINYNFISQKIGNIINNNNNNIKTIFKT